MKSESNANAPAFPQPANCGDRIKDGAIQFLDAGMSLREYYAGLALQGLCASGTLHVIDVADTAVYLADELIFKLNK